MANTGKVAVVTGSNRGIGRDVVRQLAAKGYRMVLTARDAADGEKAAAELRKAGGDIRAHDLDVQSDASCRALAAWVKAEYGQVDVLVNNAGVLLERVYGADGRPISEDDGLDVDIGVVSRILDTNTLGALRMIQALAPVMSKGSRIINLSSRMGQFGMLGPNMVGYRMSKTALKSLTACLAPALEKKGIGIFAMCPGWVRTDMGSPAAAKSVDQGADTAVWLASEAPNPKSGGFYTERKEIPW